MFEVFISFCVVYQIVDFSWFKSIEFVWSLQFSFSKFFCFDSCLLIRKTQLFSVFIMFFGINLWSMGKTFNAFGIALLIVSFIQHFLLLIFVFIFEFYILCLKFFLIRKKLTDYLFNRFSRMLFWNRKTQAMTVQMLRNWDDWHWTEAASLNVVACMNHDRSVTMLKRNRHNRHCQWCKKINF